MRRPQAKKTLAKNPRRFVSYAAENDMELVAIIIRQQPSLYERVLAQVELQLGIRKVQTVRVEPR